MEEIVKVEKNVGAAGDLIRFQFNREKNETEDEELIIELLEDMRGL